MDKSTQYNINKNKKREHLNSRETQRDNIYSTAYETECDFFKGRTSEVDLTCDENDIRLDLILDRKQIAKLWGQVKDDDGNYIESALVTLLKPKYIRGSIEYFPIATTLSDCMGFYQFEIDNLERGLKYRVTVSKS